jgi:hypothetical protein
VVRIPDVEAFLALAPEELAAKMLFLMGEANRADFHRDSLENEVWRSIGSTAPSYPRSRGAFGVRRSMGVAGGIRLIGSR